MKPLLTLSKREPVQAAIGMTADGDAVLLLDKRAKPRKVMTLLKASASKAKLTLNGASIRFGRAEVDPDYDPTMVRLFINKEAPGVMRVKLMEVVKRCAFQKVEINIDPSLEQEGEEDDQDATPEAAEAPPPAPGPSAQTLKSALTDLLSLVGHEADAGRRATLLKVAGMANEQLKAGSLEAAAATIEKLRGVVQGSPPQGQGRQAQSGGPSAAWQAARSAWQDASEAVDGQMAALAKALRDTGDEELQEIAEFGLNAVTANHKTPVMAALMDIGSGAPDAIAKGGPKALKAVQAFRQHIDTDERVAACDENPTGVPVSIKATFGPALAQLEAALTPA